MPTLFSTSDLASALSTRRQRALLQARSLPASAWGTPEQPLDVVEALITRATEGLEPPVIDWADLTLAADACDVLERVHAPDRLQPGAVNVAGIAVVALVPFAGSSQLLRLRPRRRFVGGFDPSTTVASSGQTIAVRFTGRDVPVNYVMDRLERLRGYIDRYLGWADEDVLEWRGHLVAEVSRTATSRLKQHREVAASRASTSLPNGQDSSFPRLGVSTST